MIRKTIHTAALLLFGSALAYCLLFAEAGIDQADDIESRFVTLIDAVRNGKTEVVRELINDDPGLVKKSDRLGSPLFYATRWHRHGIAEMLLKKGSDPNHRSRHGHTPLHTIMARDDDKLAAILIRHGADVNAAIVSTNGKKQYSMGSLSTPICRAAKHSAVKVLELLLKNDAKIVPKINDSKYTALHSAVTPILPAQELAERKNGGNGKIIRLLVDAGCDVNGQDDIGHTPLMRAVGQGRVDVATFLLENYAEINVLQKTPSEKRAAIHIAFTASTKLSTRVRLQLVKLLVKHNCNPAATDGYGKTALDYARSLKLDNDELTSLLGPNEDT